MDLYLITSEHFHDYTHIFQFNENKLIKLPTFQDEQIISYDSIQIKNISLPVQIVEDIVEMTIYSVLKDRNFPLALHLITFSKHLLKKFYRKWFGDDIQMLFTKAPITTYNFRMSHMFRMMEHIDDNITMKSKNDLIISSRFYNRDLFYDYDNVKIWDFNNHSFSNRTFDSHFHVHHVGTPTVFFRGPLYADAIWIIGDGTPEGLTQVSFIKTPLIIISFGDSGGYHPKIQNLKSNQACKGYSDILKMIYGPLTGVFFQVQENILFEY